MNHLANINNKCLVSFCIPTYNRSSLVKRNVLSILGYTGVEIEVIVVDDCSEDQTHEEISAINDNRIKYFRNSENINAVLNIIRSIKLANGEWVFTLSDEDLVTSKMVESIVIMLKNKIYDDVAVIIGNIRNISGKYPYYIYHNGENYVTYRFQNRIYKKGDESIYNIGFDHKYLSGILIKKEFLDFEYLNKLTQEDGLIAPHTILYTMAMRYAGGVTADMDFCLKSVDSTGKSMVRRVNNDSYKHPKNRFKQFSLYIKLADLIIVDDIVKIKTLTKLFGYYFDESTYGWNNLINSNKRAHEFGVENEKPVKMEKNIIIFYEKACRYINNYYRNNLKFKREIISSLEGRKKLIINKRNAKSQNIVK